MKTLALILASLTFVSYGKTDLGSLLKDLKEYNIPYSSQYDSDKYNKRKILTGNDSAGIVTELIAKSPKIVNNLVSSPFGQLDFKSIKDCVNFENLKEIAIIGFIKVDSNNYLLHLTFTQNGQFSMSKGILASINKFGELNDWFFANGAVTGGNPNGDVSRDFKIDKDFNIVVSESSWGKNNINYSLTATFKVLTKTSKQETNEDTENEEENNRENKIEHFDLKEGEFELINICLDI